MAEKVGESISFVAVAQKHSVFVKFEEAGKVDVGAFEDHDLRGAQGRADRPGGLGVGVPHAVDEDEQGREALDVEQRWGAFGGAGGVESSRGHAALIFSESRLGVKRGQPT